VNENENEKEKEIQKEKEKIKGNEKEKEKERETRGCSAQRSRSHVLPLRVPLRNHGDAPDAAHPPGQVHGAVVVHNTSTLRETLEVDGVEHAVVLTHMQRGRGLGGTHLLP